MTRLIAIGASAGGLGVLKRMVEDLPAELPVPVLIVLHIGKNRSLLPKILGARSRLPVLHPLHGEALRPAHIYVAPPDLHMLLERDRIVLSHGPKEHHT